MITVRNEAFETNSSSCHVITIMGKNMQDRYKRGEVLCLTDFSREEHESKLCILDDDTFYDLNSFYNFLQEYVHIIKKDLETENRDSYKYYMATFLINMTKEQCEDYFFNGNTKITDEFDNWELGDYLYDITNLHICGIKLQNYNDPIKDSNPNCCNGIKGKVVIAESYM